MSEYEVPEELLEYADRRQRSDVERRFTKAIVEAVIRWISENPRVPTDEQWKECVREWKVGRHAMEVPSYEDICPIWNRRMFLKPEPEVPEEIKDLLCLERSDSPKLYPDEMNRKVLEAFRRGERKR